MRRRCVAATSSFSQYWYLCSFSYELDVQRDNLRRWSKKTSDDSPVVQWINFRQGVEKNIWWFSRCSAEKSPTGQRKHMMILQMFSRLIFDGIQENICWFSRCSTDQSPTGRRKHMMILQMFNGSITDRPKKTSDDSPDVQRRNLRRRA